MNTEKLVKAMKQANSVKELTRALQDELLPLLEDVEGDIGRVYALAEKTVAGELMERVNEGLADIVELLEKGDHVSGLDRARELLDQTSEFLFDEEEEDED